MHDVDFLPAKYRDLGARRNITLSRVVVVGIFALAIVGAAIMQYQSSKRLIAELDSVAPLHDEAVRISQEFKATSAEVESEQKVAALVTYMRHPWPRTQILSAVMRPLPATISLDRVAISHQVAELNKAAMQPTGRKKRASRREAEADTAKLSPAERDLKNLREQSDKMQTVVTVTGHTQDRTAMYYYLSRLGESELIVKAELKLLESVSQDRRGGKRSATRNNESDNEAGQQTTKFVAHLVIRHGHGIQPQKIDDDDQTET